MIHSARGFTLVELLVVISIIAILATMGTATYRGVQARARDARRVSDITAIAAVLENNYTDYTYPTTIDSNWFVGDIPVDPINDVTYYYKSALTASGFTICGKLESTSGGNYADIDGGTKQINGPFFCVKNRQ